MKKENSMNRIIRYDYSHVKDKKKREHLEKEQSEANYFAMSLLVPELELKRLIVALGRDANVPILANHFGVPETVMRIRLKQYMRTRIY